MADTLAELLSAEMAGNLLAKVCADSLQRVMMQEPVTERNLLGLCWTMQGLSEQGWEGPELKLPRLM